MSEADDYAKQLAAEYGTYRATQVITYNGVRAYNPGDPVPVSNVVAHGYDEDGLVEKVEQETAAPSKAAPPAPFTPPTPPTAS